MPKFRITGIDRESGLSTSVVIDAYTSHEAEAEAVRRGVEVQALEPIEPEYSSIGYERLQQALAAQAAPASPPVHAAPMPVVPAFVMPPPAYWKKLKDTIASGVFWGLMTWMLFWVIVPGAVLFLLYVIAMVAG